MTTEAIAEVLPREIIEQLRAFFESKKMGSFTIHTNEKGEMVKIEEKTFIRLDKLIR